MNNSYHYYYHFSLDKSGKIETASHNSFKSDEEVQEFIDKLVEEKQIILGERVEGFIRENRCEIYIDYREYQDVKKNDFIEHQSFLSKDLVVQ